MRRVGLYSCRCLNARVPGFARAPSVASEQVIANVRAAGSAQVASEPAVSELRVESVQLVKDLHVANG